MAYLGIDGGGSGSRWLMLDDAARQLCAGDGPALQMADLGPVEVGARLGRILAHIAEEAPTPTCLVAGLAGAADASHRRQVTEVLVARGAGYPVHLVSDPVLAAGVALREGPGVAVWSGTGSFAVARDACGDLHRSGGRGHLIGDQGSAYAIALMGGKVAVEAAEGIGAGTTVLKSYTTALGVDDPSQLGPALQAMQVHELAALAQVVLAAAEAGDQQSVDLLQAAADDLLPVVLAAAKTAELDGSDLDLAIGGGVFAARIYRDLFAGALQAQGLRARVRRAGDAVHGAALLAMDLVHARNPYRKWVENGSPA